MSLFQEILCLFAAILMITSVFFQISTVNKLRKELTHIRTITALIAEKNGVMIRIQCPECDNRFWEDSSSKRTICSYCKTEFKIEDADVILNPNVNNDTYKHNQGA